MDTSLSELQERVKDREAWVLQSTGSQGFRRDVATEQQKKTFNIVSLEHLFPSSGLFKSSLGL